MEKNIVNALNRLERLGQENSRITEKAREAAKIIERKLVDIMPEQISLPMGYTILEESNGNTWCWYLSKEVNCDEYHDVTNYVDGEYIFGKKIYGGSRQTILNFSEDLANGLLEKFAEFLEKRKERMENAEKIISETAEKF